MLKIDKEKIVNLSKTIIEAQNKGVEDANKEYDNFVKDISIDSFDKNIIYKHILNWKVNYLKDLNSDYHLIDQLWRNNLSYRFLKGSEQEKFAAATLFFYDYHYKGTSITKDSFISKLNKKIIESVKKLTLYNYCNNLIYYVNNKDNGSLKLPLIEDFEISIYKELENLKIEFIELEKYQKEKLENKSEQITKLNVNINELKINNIHLKRENSDLKIDCKNLQADIDSLNYKLEAKNNYEKILLNEISKNDYTPVSQFNELYWGDNYPALKVLFDFLQRNRIVDFNWSCFASLMSLQNLEPINFSTGIYNKKEIGYLLKKIESFFTTDYTNTEIRYKGFLQRKFTLDYELLNYNFIKNNVRDYKTAQKTWVKTKNEIDILCQDISKCYF